MESTHFNFQSSTCVIKGILDRVNEMSFFLLALILLLQKGC
uniref:Uncharacterized protein n=1 Tax=Arundo donax TaxID=35708 RepID=A0A0A8YLW1_ARUDO